MLLEDEAGTLNVIVPANLYERERLTIRTEPVILVVGRLERHAHGAGAVNLLAAEARRLDPPGQSAHVTASASPTRPPAPRTASTASLRQR
jgi:error-prone DNA polymerase